MIKSLVDISWRSLTNLNKSVLDLIRIKLIKLFLYDTTTNSYSLTINNIKFTINGYNDLSITGFRFLEIDGELYLIDLKNKEAINNIKVQYFNNQLDNTNLSSTQFTDIFSNPLSNNNVKTSSFK